jgi:hypothetical protein
MEEAGALKHPPFSCFTLCHSTMRLQNRFVFLGCCLIGGSTAFILVVISSLSQLPSGVSSRLMNAKDAKTSHVSESISESSHMSAVCGDAIHACSNKGPGDVSPLAPQTGDVSEAEAETEIIPTVPFFYRIKQETFSTLAPDQQSAVLALQSRYLDYYQKKGGDYLANASDWNDVMREFHLELVARLGSATADQLLR